jgi:hypothetical protein
MARVYLSVPLVANRDMQTAKELAGVIKASGHELISPWVIGKNPNNGLDEVGVFKRDTEAVKRSDILVAEVSVPSHGVGMELMLANLLRKKVICVYRRGTKLSWMVKGLPKTALIEYENVRTLGEKLSAQLKRF